MTKAMKALMAGVAFAGLLAGIAPAAWASIFFLGQSRISGLRTRTATRNRISR